MARGIKHHPVAASGLTRFLGRVAPARRVAPSRAPYGKLHFVQYRPSAAELLHSIAELLEDEVLNSVLPAKQHQVRVAANLTRILEREALLEPGARAQEHRRLAGLLGHDGEVTELSAELASRLRAGHDAAFERDAWEALVAIARDDLAIAKPGHDSWEGE